MDKVKENGRVFTAEQKFKIVKEALTTDIGVSGVCKKYNIHSSMFYKWQEKFLEGAKEMLSRKNPTNGTAEQRKIEELNKEVDRMKNVIAEISVENIAFKKSLGEL